MDAGLSVVDLVLEASPLVQGVMGLLLLASVASWTVIFRKMAATRSAAKQAARFEDEFWSGADLTSYYRRLSETDNASGMAAVFVAGFREFARFRKQGGKSVIEEVAAITRAMRVRLSREMDELERDLPLLATIGSISPYVGLFGTVWGIMTSFIALGGQQQVTMAMVAPGIAEALIATAMGLFAAIPAVIAYNSFSSRIGRLQTRYETFADELLQILERHVHEAGEAEQQ